LWSSSAALCVHHEVALLRIILVLLFIIRSSPGSHAGVHGLLLADVLVNHIVGSKALWMERGEICQAGSCKEEPMTGNELLF
jgi:hypothetical protein